MKKIGFLFLLSLLTMTAVADDAVEINGVWYLLDAENQSATVSKSPTGAKYSGEILIPGSVTYEGVDYDVKAIAPRAFSGCSEIISVIIGNNVTTIGESAFSYSSLVSAYIGDGVVTIDRYAFYLCSSLVDVSIGNGVTTIGTSAFQWCSQLPSIIIGSSVASIGESAFYDCSSLKNVYCLAENLPSTMPTSFDSRYQPKMVIHVPASVVGTYADALPWKNFGMVVALAGDEIVKCEKPEVGYEDDHLVFTCATDHVSYLSFVRVPVNKVNTTDEVASPETFTVYVFAIKWGCYRSETATYQFSFSGFSPMSSDTKPVHFMKGDLNHDGEVNVADHVKLSSLILNGH